MTAFNIREHVKLSIALEIIFDNGFGSRKGLHTGELLILDKENTILGFVNIGFDEETGWEHVRRADLLHTLALNGVRLPVTE